MLSELAAAVRDKKVSARELVEEALHRIGAGNGSLNAVVRLRADEARTEADALDDARRTGALAGLPLLVKDLQDVAGLPTTFGTPLFSDAAPAAVGTTIVARLRGRCDRRRQDRTRPAFGWTAFTDNKVFGEPNPGTARSPGGSVVVRQPRSRPGSHRCATTTDGGGSVRSRVDVRVGQVQADARHDRALSAPRWMTFSTSGATGATVADVMLEASVLAGPTGTDVNELAAGSVAIDAVRPARVFACRTLRRDVDAEVEAAFTATVDAVERDLRLPVTRVDHVFDTEDLPLQWFAISAAELAQSLAWAEPRWDELEPWDDVWRRNQLLVAAWSGPPRVLFVEPPLVGLATDGGAHPGVRVS